MAAGELDPQVTLPAGIPTGIPTGNPYGPTPVSSLTAVDTPAIDMPAIDIPAIDTPAVNTPAVNSPPSMETTWQRPRMPTSLNEGRGKERWRWWCQCAWLDPKWVFTMGMTAWQRGLEVESGGGSEKRWCGSFQQLATFSHHVIFDGYVKQTSSQFQRARR